MKKKSLFLLFLLFPLLSFAANDSNERKTLLSTITDPTPRKLIPFHADIEDRFLAQDDDRSDALFDIRGVSQPDVENEISVFTPIPALILDFNASITGENINFTWLPRNTFFSKNSPPPNARSPHSFASIPNNPAASVPSPPNPPDDFWKIVERNETLALPPVNPPTCQPTFETSTSCSYVIQTLQDGGCPGCGVKMCTSCDPDGCSSYPCGCNFCLVCKVTGSGTKTRTCVTTYTCTDWWEGFQDEEYQTPIDPPGEVNPASDLLTTIVRPAVHSGVWEYAAWWLETSSTSETIAFLAPKTHLAAITTSETMRLFAYGNAGGGNSGSSGSSGGATGGSGESPIPNPPQPPEGRGEIPKPPPPPKVGDACGLNTCTPPPCAPPPPARGLNLIDRSPVLVDDFEKYEIWYNIEDDPDFPFLENIGVVRDSKVSRKLAISGGDNETPFRNPTDFEGGMREAKTKGTAIKTVTAPLINIVGDQTKPIHFALFEVRRIEFSDKKTPTNSVGANPDANNQRDQIDTEAPENDEGYLFTATKELTLSGSAFTASNSPQKIEFELRPAPVRANADGQFRIKDFTLLHLNPYAETHGIVGTYESTDTRFENEFERRSAGASSNRVTSGFYTQGAFVLPTQTFSIEGDPLGTVFNTWTLTPVPRAVVHIAGNALREGGRSSRFSVRERTGSDGFFRFFSP